MATYIHHIETAILEITTCILAFFLSVSPTTSLNYTGSAATTDGKLRILQRFEPCDVKIKGGCCDHERHMIPRENLNGAISYMLRSSITAPKITAAHAGMPKG